jgi:hypothetical protein
MKHALLLSLTLIVCCHREASHEKDDDSKKEGAHAGADEDKRTAAEEAIHAYETAGGCDAKAQTIVYGKSHRDLLARCTPRKIERYETSECNALTGAMTQCHATARRDGDKTRYWLVKQPNGQFLVDFLATERPIQIADLVASMPSTPSIARIRGYVSSSYKGAFRGKNKTHIALRVKSPKDDRSAWGYAYALRDSPEGIALASASKSMSDEVDLTVALSFPTKDPEVMQIDKVFGTDFFESDAEHEFAKPGDP